jgi:NAD(P) transhydrogenase subunit beta
VKTAARGNALAALGMLLAIVLTLLDVTDVDYVYIFAGLVVGSGIGAAAAVRIPMTAMPEMVALFNGFGGGASALVALSIFYRGLTAASSSSSEGAAAILGGFDKAVAGELSLLIGTATFSGSYLAYLKLRGSAIEKAMRFLGETC